MYGVGSLLSLSPLFLPLLKRKTVAPIGPAHETLAREAGLRKNHVYKNSICAVASRARRTQQKTEILEMST